MDEKDLYKLRIAEFEKNYESLRAVEWRTAIEVLTGHAAIAIAYYHLHEKHPGSKALGIAAAVLVGCLFLINLYLSIRIQERLHYTRDMRNLYTTKLHELLKVAPLTKPTNTKEPKHKRWYAFAAQLSLSALAMVSIAVYALVTSFDP